MIDGIAMWAWPPCEWKILIFARMMPADHQSILSPTGGTCILYVFLLGLYSVLRVRNPKQPLAEDNEDILQEFAGDRHPGKEHTPPHGQRAHSCTPSHLVCGTPL